MKFKSFLLLVVFALFLVGCGDEVPQQAIDDAKAALDAAKAAQADQYVPDQYNTASNQLNAALAQVEEQKEAMFSDFEEATNLLVSAKNAADEAASAVPAKKEEVKQGTESLLAQIPGEVKKTRTLWRKAPRGKESYAALKLIKEDINATESSVSEVNAALEAGDLLGAQAKAQSILSKLASIQSELQR